MTGLAKFNAHFDSYCDSCLADIYQDDPMAYDKLEGEYICERCMLERETDRSE